MGAVGFHYQHVKDDLKDANIPLKKWKNIVLDVGRYMALDDEQWAKAKRDKASGDADIAAALKAAFGDGKTNK